MNVLDFGVTDRNEPYLVLDYESGESLASYIKRVGRLPIEEALNIAIQIALGLHHAHKNGVIHRDIKPSNVILVGLQTPGEGNSDDIDKPAYRIAKIVDFGLAKSVNEVQSLTQAGTGLGTPRYMSPEHIRGIEVDQRSDIYSLGCLIFETLTGVVPFQGQTVMETLNMHLHEPPPSMASKGIECSKNLDQIMAGCLSKAPGERFQSAGGLVEKLKSELGDIEKARSLQESESRKELPTQNMRQPEAVLKDKRRLIIVAVVIVILSAVLCWIVNEQSKQQVASGVVKEQRVPSMVINSFESGLEKDKIFEDYTRGHGSNIWTTNHATDKDVKEFLKNGLKGKIIKGIDLTGSNLGRAGYKMLADKTKLTYLECINQPITRNSLSNIALITSLEDIRLGGQNENFEPKSLLEFTKLKNLTNLYIGEMKLDESAFEAMSHLKHLSVIELSGCTGVTPAGLKHLLKLNNLAILNLDSTDVDDQSVNSLTTHPNLTKLLLHNTRITKGVLNQIKNMPSLSQLDLTENKAFTETDAEQLENQMRRKGRSLDVWVGRPEGSSLGR